MSVRAFRGVGRTGLIIHLPRWNFSIWSWLLLPTFLTCGSLVPFLEISISSSFPTLPRTKREISIKRIIFFLPISCNLIIAVSGGITRSQFLKLSLFSFEIVSINCWDTRTGIHQANLSLSVYCLLAKLSSGKYVVPSYPRGANNSSSVVLLVRLQMYIYFISGLCMFFLLLLTIRVHSESSVWVDFWYSLRGQSSHDLFFLYSVSSSFFYICSSFNIFSLFFLLSGVWR